MNVLIVESKADLAHLWQRHLEREGMDVSVAADGDSAMRLVAANDYDVIILDLIIAEGSALAVADYAQYRWPETSVIFVTDTTFFSDGSIFSLIPNARAFVRSATPPGDLAAMVEHYGRPA
jgi:DNA-binding response OmpR family regulator